MTSLALRASALCLGSLAWACIGSVGSGVELEAAPSSQPSPPKLQAAQDVQDVQGADCPAEDRAGVLNPAGRSAEVAIFAGGCFWCVEASLEPLKGVKRVISGYTGGTKPSPSYAEVSAAQTDHLEAVWVEFDPKVVSYRELVEAFWRSIDPTQRDGQFADRGPQYLTAIFYLDEAQKTVAERSRAQLAQSGRFKRPLYTPLRPASLFWPAEAYHQDYYKTNERHYQRYKESSGRGPFLRRVWGGAH